MALSVAGEQAAAEFRVFLEQMFDGQRFSPGIDTAGVVNTSDVYLDPQSWGVLALSPMGDNGADFGVGLQFNCDEFVETAGYINYRSAGALGFFDVFFPPRPKTRFVWTEGTLGMVMADITECAGYGPDEFLEPTRELVDDDGGVPYATYTTNTDFVASSSVAGTAWLYFVDQGYNPFAPL